MASTAFSACAHRGRVAAFAFGSNPPPPSLAETPEAASEASDVRRADAVRTRFLRCRPETRTGVQRALQHIIEQERKRFQ